MVILIYGIKEWFNLIKGRLLDVIYGSMCDVLGMFEDKCVYCFIFMEVVDFYYSGGCSDVYMVIEINMMVGWCLEIQKVLIKMLFECIEMELGIWLVDVEIMLYEQLFYCWGFCGMIGDEVVDLKYQVKVQMFYGIDDVLFGKQ